MRSSLQVLSPTCQRHLFSTYKITPSTTRKLARLFVHPAFTDGPYKGTSPRARLADLLDAYTTHLVFTDHPELITGNEPMIHLPKFKNVQRVTFKGNELNSAVTIPSFLKPTWTSPSSKIRSVEFDFYQVGERVLESFYTLPATVEDVSLACTMASPTATSTRGWLGVDSQLTPIAWRHAGSVAP